MRNINKRILISLILIIILIIIILFGMFFSYEKLKGQAKIIYKNGNENLSMEIENYNKEDGIVYRNTMQVLINAKFKSDSSSNKKVVITLPEGMTYDSYFVKEGADEIIKKQLEESADLYKAISSVETPEIFLTGFPNTGVERYSYGDLVYHVNDNITSVSITINIKADAFRFYGEKLLENAIKISTFENGEKLEELSEDILLKEEILTGFKFSLYTRDTTYYKTSKMFATTNEKKSYARTHITGLFVKYNSYNSASNLEFTPHYKELTYYIYYPEGTVFEGFYNGQNNNITGMIDTLKDQGVLSYQVDNKNNLAKVTFYEHKNMSYGIGVIFSASENLLSNNDNVQKSNPSKNKMVATFYDGVQKEITGAYDYNVDIYHPRTFVNKISTAVTEHYDDDDDSTFVFGPMFRIINKTPGEKKNQTLEFNFDDNYQVVAAYFPFDTGIAEISNISYKTNKTGDKWITYNEEWKKSKFTKFDAGYKEGDGVFFTAIKATISLYAEDYETGIAAAKAESNAILYGNLLSSTKKANVTLLTYDEENKENTLTSLSSTISKIEGRKITAAYSQQNLYKIDKEVVNAGESFNMEATFSIHSYPYGNVEYLDNAEIYIRQPIGTTINLNDVILKDNSGNNVHYTVKNHVNKFGETIYVLKTNYRVGRLLTEKMRVKELVISVPVKVNLDAKIVSLKMFDIIAWGNDRSVEHQATNKATDIYDFDGDGNYEEVLFPTGNNAISVLPSKSVVVSTYISKNGTEGLPYDKENPETILQISKLDRLDYKIKVWNNSVSSVDDFEMYIPIPKKSNNFENDSSYLFEWDMSLISTINVPSKFEVFYATENNKDISKRNYNSDIPDNLNKVSAIKIVLKDVLYEEEENIISIPLVVDEERKNASQYNNKLNIWYPKYMISTSTISGAFDGTGVGLRLFANEISGNTYYDNNANGIYDEGIDKSTSDIGISFYKLNNEAYEKIDAKINYDMETKEFYIDEYELKDSEIYALKFNIPEGYFITTHNNNWITKITTSDLFNKDIGIVSYELDFDTKDYILYKGEEKEINIQNIKPVFFDNVKHNEVAYIWELVDKEDSKYIELTNSNDEYINVKALQEKGSIKVKVSIFDRFGNTKSKELNIKIKATADPTIIAENQTIDISNKIEFKKYVKDAINYKDEKVELIWSGDNKNITYEHNIPNIKGYASKVGSYFITYHLKDEYGTTSKTIKLIVDDKFNIKNPSTSDTLSKIILLLSSVITLTLIIIHKIKR